MFRTLFGCGFACFALGLWGQAQDSVRNDEATLRSAGIATDDKSLLEFFRRRSLKDGDREMILKLVQQLSSDVYKERKQAERDLVLRGPLALPFLNDAVKKPVDLEQKRRAEKLIRDIEKSKGPDHPAAAARLLAARNLPGAIEVLFNYIPYAENPLTEEDVLTSLGVLTLRGGKVDPLLLAALKDPLAERRAAAVYILGRRGETDQRETVRQLLADPNPHVGQRAAQGLVGKSLFRSLEDTAAADTALLKAHNIGADRAGLLDVLHKRTLSEEDQARIRTWIRQLGSDSFPVRMAASKKLVDQGSSVLNFLVEAADSRDLEVNRRVGQCIEKIKKGPGPALPMAAIRLLARPGDKGSPTGAIRDMLAYAPFAEDAQVEEELLGSLCVLATREPKVEPLLTAALQDPMAIRRGAAAFVLGRIGAKDQVDAVHKLLTDKSPAVRWRSAQGLLAARDEAAVPVLIALLAEAKDQQLWQVEDLLHRLAGDKAPAENASDTAKDARAKAVKAWEKWFQAHAKDIDLARAADGESYLGLTTIVEYDSFNRPGGGRVWECGRDGQPRWKIENLLGPMDAQVLSNGRVLIAENSANRVTERDHQGQVHWEFRVQNGNPIACQRLPNGNTFIATYNRVMEIRPNKDVVYDTNRNNPQFYNFSARKLRNGHVLVMSSQGVVSEFDPVTNRDVRTVQVGMAGGWCGAEALPNGRYLVATMAGGNGGFVKEYDAANKSYDVCTYQGAFRAVRLPNGHTLVASMTTRRVAEFDRTGRQVRDIPCTGRPWMVRYR